MHISTIEREVGWSETFLPFLLVKRNSILIMIANYREEFHRGRTESSTNLSLQLLIVTAIILHIIAHAQAIYRHSSRKAADSLLDIGHCFVLKTIQIALLNLVICTIDKIRTVSIGDLRVANNNHLIDFLHPSRHPGKLKIVRIFILFNRLIEVGCIVG